MFPQGTDRSTLDKFRETATSDRPVDYNFVMNIMDFFPLVFIRILEEVYPMDLSLQNQANLLEQIVNCNVRFDLSKTSQVDRQLKRWMDILRDQNEKDVVGQKYTILHSRLKEFLFKENPDFHTAADNGPAYGHQLPSGKWLFHTMTSKQAARCREKLQSTEFAQLNSFKLLCIEISKMFKKGQKLLSEAMEEGYNIVFLQQSCFTRKTRRQHRG